jgi:hypothetical protein
MDITIHKARDADGDAPAKRPEFWIAMWVFSDGSIRTDAHDNLPAAEREVARGRRIYGGTGAHSFAIIHVPAST